MSKFEINTETLKNFRTPFYQGQVQKVMQQGHEKCTKLQAFLLLDIDS